MACTVYQIGGLVFIFQSASNNPEQRRLGGQFEVKGTYRYTSYRPSPQR
jgi:hypothetical protein